MPDYLAKFDDPQFRLEVLRAYFEAGADFDDAFQVAGLDEADRERALRGWAEWELYEAA